MVILATPWGATLGALRQVAGDLVGKVVWDTTNPPKADMSGLEIGLTTSAGGDIARAAPGANVIKAVPPFAEVLHSPSNLIDGRKPGVFVYGDNAEVRKTVLILLADIDADVVDGGLLSLARHTEP